MSNIFTLNKTQIKVLLRGLGFSKVAGLNIGEEPLDDFSVAAALNELMKKGFLTSSGDELVMNEEIRRIAVLLGESNHYVTIRSKKEELPDLCCFFGDEILVCSALVTNPDFFTVCFFEARDLFQELSDQGYFPENDEEILFDEDKLPDFEDMIFSGIESNQPFSQGEQILLSVDLPDGKYVRIIEYFFCDYIVICEEQRFRRLAYSLGEMEKIFIKLMG